MLNLAESCCFKLCKSFDSNLLLIAPRVAPYRLPLQDQ
jgi:hypothetical protein